MVYSDSQQQFEAYMVSLACCKDDMLAQRWGDMNLEAQLIFWDIQFGV